MQTSVYVNNAFTVTDDAVKAQAAVVFADRLHVDVASLDMDAVTILHADPDTLAEWNNTAYLVEYKPA